MVSGEDQYILRIVAADEPQVLVNGVGRSQEPFGALRALIGRQYMHPAEFQIHVPGFAPAQVVIQLQRLVLRQDTDGIDVGVGAVGQREVDDPVLASEWDRGFGSRLRQRDQPAALTTGQKHGYDLLSFAHVTTISFRV